MSPEPPRRLFVYGTLLQGEPEHALLASAERLGPARTEAAFHLVDLVTCAALVPGGSVAVVGDLYAVERTGLAAIDIARQVPLLFQRVRIRLEDGELAETHVMAMEQVQGRRRLEHGDWGKRFAGKPRGSESPFAKWAKGRFTDRG